MSFMDYYLCDNCAGKTFYDADLSYEGKNHNKITGKPWPSGDIGLMIVLCEECEGKLQIGKQLTFWEKK